MRFCFRHSLSIAQEAPFMQRAALIHRASAPETIFSKK
ncbi:hypothetical protein HMPREF0860_1665 [Treponema socranskii subsp. socranskii VPI DR56BR1116 = ATCC 35536]|uniref:Uncharacterized protein n=1 Tax=Treponema socranskii subsp. socranskii VPI DR56BR1116 = ATCC 35536 TaxID=1125725 RepID=U1GPP3_TRESO|nr:hypothetical protein HMPREF1325_0542 [Treponema socranskii subsp. socranskii VPI DR56BR1116 = ATCC 35536]ERK04377.1 hypothetical protein HMPREF0860_1665 [Treponema socranskii subsp. socranskii VPI DR56BR1116 = ATCC 35536]